MSLRRSYQLFALFYSLLLVVGLIALLAGGGTPLAFAHLVVGALAVLGLWGYILQRGFMGPRMWRPLAALLAVGVVVQLFVLLSVSLSGPLTTWMLTSAVFSALLVIILYRYGDRDQAIWATPEELEAAQRLEALMKGQNRLAAQKREDGREARVEVVKSDDGYRASVTRRREGQEEAFEESFHHPATLVFFLEKFAGLSVDDFQGTDPA